MPVSVWRNRIGQITGTTKGNFDALTGIKTSSRDENVGGNVQLDLILLKASALQVVLGHWRKFQNSHYRLVSLFGKQFTLTSLPWRIEKPQNGEHGRTLSNQQLVDARHRPRLLTPMCEWCRPSLSLDYSCLKTRQNSRHIRFYFIPPFSFKSDSV